MIHTKKRCLYLFCMGIGSFSSFSMSEEAHSLLPESPKKHYWADLNFGGANGKYFTLGLQAHFAANEKQWMASFRKYDQDFLFRTINERGTGTSIDGEIKEISLSRVWHKAGTWRYVDTSVGISLLKGRIGTNCGKSEIGFLNSTQQCDKKVFTTLGIPIRLSAGAGRYLGLAIHLDINLNIEEPTIGGSSSIPIGTFAR